MPQKLAPSTLESALLGLPGWKLQSGEIVRTVEFPDFIRSIAFVNKVAALAEQAGHHPDIDIRYNKVRLALVTHDAGGITQNDIDMAKKLNEQL